MGAGTQIWIFGDGITESLINSMSQVLNLLVMSRNSVFRYKGRQTDAMATGKALTVKAVVTGRVMQRGDNLSISTELIEVGSNRQLWGEQYNRKLVDILAVQEEMSTEISEKLRFKLICEERKRLSRRYTQNTEAYQLYLKGRYYWNKKTAAGFNKGIEYFQKAVEVDANYAPAYAGLATCYTNLANYNYALISPKEAWGRPKRRLTRRLRSMIAWPRLTPRWHWWPINGRGTGRKPKRNSDEPSSWIRVPVLHMNPAHPRLITGIRTTS